MQRESSNQKNTNHYAFIKGNSGSSTEQGLITDKYSASGTNYLANSACLWVLQARPRPLVPPLPRTPLLVLLSTRP